MSLSFDAQLTPLGTVQRRQLLAELLTVGAEESIETRAFADRLQGDTGRTLLQLHHVHVPVLLDLDVIAMADGGDAGIDDATDAQ